MHEANQILGAIKRKKAIYMKMLKETDSISEGMNFQEKIDAVLTAIRKTIGRKIGFKEVE